MKPLELAPEFYRGCAAPGRRMDDDLLDFFNETPGRRLRALCPAGVRVQFATDARELGFSLVFGGAARPVYTTDLEIGDKLLTFDGPGPHRAELPEGENVVTMHLPHLVEVPELCIRLSDGANARPVPPPAKRLLFCGDSIMQGMVTTSPARAFPAIVAKRLNMDFLNTSVGGARLAPEHVRLTARLGGDALIVALGVNDAGSHTPLDAFRAAAKEALAELAAFPGGKYLVLPIPNVSGSTPTLPDYRAILQECTAAYPAVTVLDGYGFFPADPTYYADGIHPNDRGNQIFADELVKVLRKEE